MTKLMKFVSGTIVCRKLEGKKTNYRCGFISSGSPKRFPKEFQEWDAVGREQDMGGFDEMKFINASEMVVSNNGSVIARYNRYKKRVCFFHAFAEGIVLYCEEMK